MKASDAFARYRPIIDDWTAFLDTLDRPLPACVWTNTLRETPAALKDKLARHKVDAQALAWNPNAFRLPAGTKPGKLWPLVAGLYQIQEEVSMLPPLFLEPQPGERILDMCASPGNKTAQMAVAMNGRGSVVANDVNTGRMAPLRHSIERLSLFNVSMTRADAMSLPYAIGRFDRVLLDAPCSCEGTSRKNTGVEAGLIAGGYRKNVDRQKAMLRRAVKLCREGGRIVYSTCTFAPEENELVLDEVLSSFGWDLFQVRPARFDGLVATPGLVEWNGQKLHSSLENCLRVWPHHNDTGGFFVAVIDKVGDHRFKPMLEDPPAALPTCDSESQDELARTLNYITERFGLADTRFDHLSFFPGRNNGYYAVSADHQPPREPVPAATGVYFVKTALRYPKPSTSAAMSFGDHATKHVVEVDYEQLRNYVARGTFPLLSEQTDLCRTPGWVVVRHEGSTLGMGLLRLNAGAWSLEGLFPKGWSWGVA